MNGCNTGRVTDERISRRQVLATAGAAGTVSLAGCGILGGGSDDGDGGGDDTVRVGVSIPRDSGRINDGEHLEDGYRLAATHINEGAGATTVAPWDDISEGVLGSDLQLEFRGTSSTRSGAQQAAEFFLEEGFDAFTGGATAREGVGHQDAAAGESIVYMGAFTPLSSLWNRFCAENIFNEMYTPRKAAAAVRESLTEQFGEGEDITFAQLYPDNDFGVDLETQIRREVQSISRNWSQNRSDATSQSVRSFESPLSEVLGTSPDLIVLNYTGRTAARALSELRNQNDSIAVVVPIINRVTAQLAGADLEGAIGTAPWHPEFDDEFSQEFAASWDDAETNRENPSDLAYLAYVQLCQYVAGVERAGSTDPTEVVGALQDHSYAFGSREKELDACNEAPPVSVARVTGLAADQQTAAQYLSLDGLVSA